MESLVVIAGDSGSNFSLGMLRELASELDNAGQVWVVKTDAYGKPQTLQISKHSAIGKEVFARPDSQSLEALGVPVFIVTLATAEAFRILYEVVCKRIGDTTANEITIMRRDKSVTIEGRSIPHVHDLLNQLFPEGLNDAGEENQEK
jgi:hypothetical protein